MTKKKSAAGAKLIWAFNPFQDDLKALGAASRAAIGISEQAGIQAEPVYVVSPAEVNVVLEFSIPARERYRQVSLQRSREVLEKLKASHLEPTILLEKSLSLSASVQVLADYARQEKAELILTGTRSGKGLGGALLGSFAETLIHQARTPVLLFNPGTPTKPLARLLFLSDLSRGSRQVFSQFCRFAAALGAEVRLFHSIPRPFRWASFAVDALLGPDRMTEKQYLLAAQKEREAEIKPFQEMAKRHGLRFSHELAVGGEDVAAEALKAAKKFKADLLGVAGQSGRLKTRLLGSVTKSLLRSSKLPLWIEQASNRGTK